MSYRQPTMLVEDYMNSPNARQLRKLIPTKIMFPSLYWICICCYCASICYSALPLSCKSNRYMKVCGQRKIHDLTPKENMGHEDTHSRAKNIGKARSASSNANNFTDGQVLTSSLF